MLHFGLIGRSLGHSFSAKFFTAKFGSEGIDADYRLIEMERIDDVRKVVATNLLAGFNVTIPYKEAIIPYLDELSDEAREVGAVNCVVTEGDKLVGYNTDVRGVEASLHWLDIEPSMRAIILGTGGASKAVQHVLHQNNTPFITVSRDKGRGDICYDELSAELIGDHKLIINATPVGMSPATDAAPMLDYSAIGEGHRLFDLVYNPATTEFLRRGAAQGATTMGGMMMLQTQAIASWHIWNRE